MNVLGVTISSEVGMHLSMKRFQRQERDYTIYQVKRAGINQNYLIRIYVIVVRPVVEYPCLV